MDKILYNLRYHLPEFYDEKFPQSIKKLPGYEKIIDLVVEQNKDNSPLKEIAQLTEEKNKDKKYNGDEVSER